MTDSTPNPSSAIAIAARVRGLLAGQDAGVVEDTARRLGVSELALRMTIDETAPVPALEVVLAIIREYGVDPTWLVSGEYDSQTHRIALDTEQRRHAEAVKALVAARMTPSSSTIIPAPDVLRRA